MLLEIVLLGVALLLLIKIFRKPSDLPPGPWGLPIIGALPPKGVSIVQYIRDLRSKHGQVFCVKMGSRLFVILSDFQLIKNTFNRSEFQGRPDFYTLDFFKLSENLGIINSTDTVWQNTRRFALRHLRDLGLGKTRLQDTILQEAKALITDLETKKVGKPMELSWNFNVAVLNVIWSLVADRRYEVDDQEIQDFTEMVSADFEVIQGKAVILDLFPWLIPIVPHFVKENWMNVAKIRDNVDRFMAFAKKIIQDHEANLDPNNPKDLIDMYLMEIEAQKDDPDTTFRKDWKGLLVTIGDLFAAGSETTSSTLRWIVLYLAKYPDVQEKIHKEIDEAVPRDRLPTLEDKHKLQYLEATIHEINRKVSLIPTGVIHMTTSETTLAGYRIPKGSLTAADIEGCHNDKRYWDDPEEFKPERFLDNEGKLLGKRDGFLPFSVGRRVCLGESLARMELYIFTAALLQKFQMTAPPGAVLDMEPERSMPIINFVKPFKVILTVRE